MRRGRRPTGLLLACCLEGEGRGGSSEVPVQLDTYMGEGVATYVTRYTLHTEHA